MYLRMKHARAHSVFSMAILLACCACAFALDPSLDVSQYAHTSWKIRDGFTRGRVTAIAQTSDGYLWLGTEFGILRFDGVRAVPWQPSGGQEPPSSLVRQLLATRDGTLWIATQNGLWSWKDGKLVSYPEFAGHITGPLLEDRQGTVWVGRSQPGDVCKIRGPKPECQRVGISGVPGPIYEDRNGNLWVSDYMTLWRWAPSPAKRYALPAAVPYVNSLTEEDGTLLLSTAKGLEQLVGGAIRSYVLPGVPRDIGCNGFFRSSDGSLWIGTGQGLLHMHNGRIDKFTASDGLSDDYVVALFEDREGNVWVSTQGGLDRFRELAVPMIAKNQGLPSSVVNSVQATPDGSVWVGTSVGLSRWRAGHLTTYRSRGALVRETGPNDGHSSANTTTEISGSGLAGGIFTLGADDSGRLWVSTRDAMFRFDRDRFVQLHDLPGGVVASIRGDGHGNLWVLHADKGLFKWTSSGVVERLSWPRPTERYWAALLPDRAEGGLWIGFWDDAGGMDYLKDGQIRASYSSAGGLGKGPVYDLRFGPHGALWAATAGGLSRVKEGSVQTLSIKNGLPCDTIFWSREDDDHSAWLYMPCGLVRVERSELDAWIADPRRIVKAAVFDITDGVRTPFGLGGSTPQVTKSHDGKLWFAAVDGVGVIDPHHLAFNKLPPPVHIEKITADDKTVEISNGMHLPTAVRHLDIDYTAVSLVVPEKVRFRVKLEGQDKDWRELVNVRHVEYTNLPPKHYRFRVLACNNSGVWNEEGATLDFVIPPAWYQTNWFYAVCAATFLALLWVAYQLRVRQLAYQFNIRLEERVGERTRVARDLHDTLLQSVQALLPSLQAGINMLATRPADARKVLEATADHASQAIAEGRDAVQGLRMSTVEKNDLAIAIRTVGEELASAASTQPSPNFNVVVEGASRNLHPILRDEVYRLAVEALRNAFRHAAAQNVEVEIRYDEKYFRLRVRDDGKGIPSDVLRGDGRKGHYGLPGMTERAKLVGGKLTIWTELTSGTEIELNIPGARAYVKSDADLLAFWEAVRDRYR